MGAFSGLTEFFGCNLAQLAAQLHYSEDNILVLQGDAAHLQKEYPEIYHNILSCKHNRDKRTPIHYAQDVVASWLFEDYLAAKFCQLGRNLTLTGGDRGRKLLPQAKVSSSSDCKYHHNGNILKVEIMNGYTSYWKNQGCLDLRDSKYDQLCADKGVLLCVDTSDRTFAIIDFTEAPPPAEYIPHHWPYGDKPAYRLLLSNVHFHAFLAQNIIDDLDELLE